MIVVKVNLLRNYKRSIKAKVFLLERSNVQMVEQRIEEELDEERVLFLKRCEWDWGPPIWRIFLQGGFRSIQAEMHKTRYISSTESILDLKIVGR